MHRTLSPGDEFDKMHKEENEDEQERPEYCRCNEFICSCDELCDDEHTSNTSVDDVASLGNGNSVSQSLFVDSD